MRKTVSIAALSVVAAIGLAAFAISCGSSTDVKRKVYVANLSAANENPVRTSAGSGVATFDDIGSQIDWTLELTNMTAVTASHIHLGAATATTASSPVIINLFIPNGTTGTLNGLVAQGTVTNANNASISLDSLRVLFNNGNSFVNVHTTANPGGELRGLIAVK